MDVKKKRSVAYRWLVLSLEIRPPAFLLALITRHDEERLLFQIFVERTQALLIIVFVHIDRLLGTGYHFNRHVVIAPGTRGTRNGITSATDDIEIITLPNGTHLAVAAFVSDSAANDDTRDAIIARLAKAAWDRATSLGR